MPVGGGARAELECDAQEQRRIGEHEPLLHEHARVEEGARRRERRRRLREAECAASEEEQRRQRRALERGANAQRVQVDGRWDGLRDLSPCLLRRVAAEPREEREDLLAERRVDVEKVLAAQVAVHELTKVVLVKDHLARVLDHRHAREHAQCEDRRREESVGRGCHLTILALALM